MRISCFVVMIIAVSLSDTQRKCLAMTKTSNNRVVLFCIFVNPYEMSIFVNDLLGCNKCIERSIGL